MSFGGGTSQMPAGDPKQLNVNSTSSSTNQQADPLPYLAGKRRFAGMFMTDAFDQSNQTLGGGGKNSGKGGGGSGTNYYASWAVAFCVGACDGFHGVYLNGDDVFTTNTRITAAQLQEANNVATFTSSGAHGLTTGETVLVNGAQQTEFNGEFVVTVLSATVFQYTIPGTSLAVEFASGNIYAYAKLAPIYRGAEDSISITIPGYGLLTLYWGTETQPADGYLPISGVNHSPMHGVCYAVFRQFYLGLNQTNIQNIEVVLSRTPSAPWQANPGENAISDEANPAIVFYDLLTHPRAGMGLTDADFDTVALAAAGTRFKTEGLGVSPILMRGDSAMSILQQLCESVDAIVILNAAGQLSLVPVRAPANYGAVPVLADAQLADLPKVKASDWTSTFNQTRIVFPNRDALWNDDFVEWFDFSAITSAQKIAQPQTLQRDWITQRSNALALVKCAGVIGSVPPAGGTLDLIFTPALWSSLAPGTVFQNNFTLRTQANGYFRVVKRTFNKSNKPTFTIEYQADRSYLNFGF